MTKLRMMSDRIGMVLRSTWDDGWSVTTHVWLASGCLGLGLLAALSASFG